MQLQLVKLQRLLHYVRENVPYYESVLKVLPERLNSLADLRRLPRLDKSMIRANFVGMRSRKKLPCDLSNTGGSSGEPLIFWLARHRQAAQKAHRIRTHRWWGVEPADKEIYLWGAPVELRKQDRLKLFRDWLINEKLLNAFNMTEESITRYLQIVQSFRPQSLFGYPSSMVLLCEHALTKKLNPCDLGIKSVFCTGEVLYEHQRTLINEALGAPVANGYGARDAGFIAHECPAGSMHIAAEHVIAEVLDDSGQPLPPNEMGEIVITNLDELAMPLIRYRTGDIGALSSEDCRCGRGLPLMKVVQGRTTDFIVTENGGRMHALGLIYVLREISGISRFQIIQRSRNHIDILIVKNDEFPAAGADTIVRSFRKRVGDNTNVFVQFVDRISATGSGKFRYVISHVSH